MDEKMSLKDTLIMAGTLIFLFFGPLVLGILFPRV